MSTIITVLLIALIVSSVWNLLSLKGIKKLNRLNKEMTDDRYFELKYKIEYITAIIVVVLGVGGFFGYKWFDEIKIDAAKNLKEKTNQYDNKFDSIDSKLKLTENIIRLYSGKLDEYEKHSNNIQSSQEFITKKIQNSSGELSGITEKIKAINEKNIIKQDFYIIDNLKIDTQDTNYVHRFYFKDLHTLLGDKLPIFSKPPFLIAVPENLIEIDIISINSEYFEINLSSYFEDINPGIFSLMISQK